MDSTHTPQIRLDSAANADGSVICTLYGTTVVATINGPLEVSRRDESTEEATLEVELRPSHGAAAPQLRYLEDVIKKTMRQVILVKHLPRSLIQLSLQITSLPRSGEVDIRLPGKRSLPALLTASGVAALAAGIPMSTMLVTAMIEHDPRTKPVKAAPRGKVGNYSHIFAFSGEQDIMLVEAEGDFDIQSLISSEQTAREICFPAVSSEEIVMGDDETEYRPAQGTLADIQKALQTQLPVT